MVHQDEAEQIYSPRLGKGTQLGDLVPISQLKEQEQVLIPLL